MPEPQTSPPRCPEALRIDENVPMAHVVDVDRSVEFYKLLGFGVDSRFCGHDGATAWSSLSSGKARMMLTRASGPIIASQQAVLFYMYAKNVQALREHLLASGLADAGRPPGELDAAVADLIPPGAAVFEIHQPFYMPDGELRIHDPDGYCILVGQLGL